MLQSRPLRIVLAVLGVLVVLFAAIQLVPVQRTNPAVYAEPAWDSPQTRAVAERSCFACHSNETRWPFYAAIAPSSWLVARDVNKGRMHLNLSEWGKPGSEQHVDEIEGALGAGKMPLWYYLPLNPQASLTPAERDALVQGLLKTAANSPLAGE